MKYSRRSGGFRFQDIDPADKDDRRRKQEARQRLLGAESIPEWLYKRNAERKQKERRVFTPTRGTPIPLSKELLMKGRSVNGGWSKAQTDLLGVEWPLPLGWQSDVIGRKYDLADLEKFLALKDAHLKSPNGKISKKKKKQDNEDRWASGYNRPQEYVSPYPPTQEIIDECPFELIPPSRRIAVEERDLDTEFLFATAGL